MAQTMTGTAIGRVNRRFLLLAAILAVLFGVLAYVALSDSGGEGGSATGGEIIDLLLSLSGEDRRTVVVVTHDTEIASRAHRIIRMHDGQLVSD